MLEYILSEKRPFFQISPRQDELGLRYERSPIIKWQGQTKSSFATVDLNELQKNIARTIDKNSLQGMRIDFPNVSSELKAKFPFSTEPDNIRDRAIYPEPEPPQSATAEKLKPVPGVIDKSVTVTLLQKMKQDEFVAGETTSSEIYIKEIASKYGWQNTMPWLNGIYLDNYSNSAILSGLLHCLSHFEYDDVKPTGPTMALGVLQHQDVYVRDLAIRAYENWNDKEALPILKALSCEAEWLQEYIDGVIKGLES